MTSVTLIQFPGLRSGATISPPCGKVQMALRYKGVSFRLKNVRTTRQVKRYNPRGRMPAILFDDHSVVDSTDILVALEERFPEPPLQPADPLVRAEAKILEDWADENLYFYGAWLRWCKPANCARMKRVLFSRLPAPVRWIAPGVVQRMLRKRVVGQGVGVKDQATVEREFAECLDAMATLLDARPFLAGDSLSGADLAACAILDQLRLRQLTPGEADGIESHAAIVAWAEKVHQLAPCAT